MKLIDLFEYDPKMGAALQKFAGGVTQAASNLDGPLSLTKKQQEIQNQIADLNKFIAQKRAGNYKGASKGADGKPMPNPEYPIALAFSEWAKELGNKAGIKSFGLNVEPDKIVINNKVNSSYVRGLIGQIVDQLVASDKKDKKAQQKVKGGGAGMFKSRPEKI